MVVEVEHDVHLCPGPDPVAGNGDGQEPEPETCTLHE